MRYDDAIIDGVFSTQTLSKRLEIFFFPLFKTSRFLAIREYLEAPKDYAMYDLISPHSLNLLDK